MSTQCPSAKRYSNHCKQNNRETLYYIFIHILYSSYCGLDEFIPEIQKLVLKHALVGKAKDPKKDGIPCYNDSGTPLFMKKGKRYVQIGMK